MSRTPWDWDEILFCLALGEYDVTEHHPHPPGFPLYIALGKLIRLIVGNDFRSLQMINLVAGVLLFPAVFRLARELRFSFSSSVSAGWICCFLPSVWFFGGTAFSDVPSLTMSVYACALLLQGCRDRRAYLLGVLVLALSLGIRPQSLLIGMFPLILASGYRLSERRFVDLCLALLIILAVVGAAYGGSIAASSSWPEYHAAVQRQSERVAAVDSFRAPDRPSLWTLAGKFFHSPYRTKRIGHLVWLFGLISVFLSIRGRRWQPFAVMAIFLPAAVVAWLFLDHSNVTRYSIAYAPLFALLAADGIALLADRFESFGISPLTEQALTLALVITLVVWAAPGIAAARNSASPPVAAAEWINKNLDPGRSRLYVDKRLSPFADYLLPRYRHAVMANELPHQATPTYALVEGLASEEGAKNFVRERGRLADIARRRFFEVSVAPVRQTAWFGEGWYAVDGDERNRGRWMGRRSFTELSPIDSLAQLNLEFEVPSEWREMPIVTIVLNDREIDRFRVKSLYESRTWRVAGRGDGKNILVLEIDKTLNPRALGLTPDPRDLGLRLRFLSWSRAVSAPR